MITDLVALRGSQAVLLALRLAPSLVAAAGGRHAEAAVAVTAAPASSPSASGAAATTAATSATTAAGTDTGVSASTSSASLAPASSTGLAASNSTTSTTAATGDFPTILLSCLIWSAVAAALIVLVLPERTHEQRDRIRVMGLVGVGFPFLFALAGLNFEISQDLLGGQISFEEVHSWITTAPVHLDYHLAADGVSLPLLLVSTVVFGAAMVASWRVDHRVRLYVVLMLLTEAGVNGSLCAFDYSMLVLFQGLELIPTFLLVAIWGGEGARRAAGRLLGMRLASLALLLVATVVIGLKAAQGSFDFLQVTGPAGSGVILTGGAATLCFWLTFLAFAVRVPVVPLHRWFVDSVSEASGPVAAVIGGAAALVGGYGMLRVVLSGFPGPAHRYSLLIAVLAVVTAGWGALGAVGQDGLRRLVGYAAVGQFGVVLLAISAQTSIAMDGAVFLLAADGLTCALLLMVAATVEERARVRRISRLGGLAWQMPKLTALWMVGGLSAVGVPFLAAFAGEIQLVAGAYPAHRLATVAVVACSLLTTGWLLLSLQRVFFGPAREAFARVRDATTLDLFALLPIVVVMVLFGLVPGRIIPIVNNGVEFISARLSGG